DPSSGAGRGMDFDFPADVVEAFADVEQPEPAGAGEVAAEPGGFKADAVVTDGDGDGVVVARDGELDAGGVGVLDDVVKELAGGLVKHDLHSLVQRLVGAIVAEGREQAFA